MARCFFAEKEKQAETPFINSIKTGTKYVNMVDNPCYGCVYENIDDTTENIGKCVCCKRNVDFAKNDYYTQKEGE